jgi:putative membrane protein insertion efficiency factor
VNTEAVTANVTGDTGPGIPVRLLLLPITGYRRFVSPFLPPACRFEPSCSAYAAEALVVHGVWRGLYLAVRRLLRCGPWHPGGLDPVPPRRSGDHGPAVRRQDRVLQTPAEE